MDEEPVEILVKMAESGEIDPWNIDIIEVTDRFLAEVERRQKLDLNVSGRTLFYASVLLRMKSDFMNQEEEPEEEPFPEEEGGFEFENAFSSDGFHNPIDRFEHEIQRRIKRKDKRTRPVTLYDLIKQLKTAEKMERRGQRHRRPELNVYFDADDVVSVAHEEGFAEDEDLVFSSFERVANGRERVPIGDLCRDLDRSIKSVYLPLLFLMLEGRLVLVQDEFFGEVYAMKWSEESASPESPGAAVPENDSRQSAE